MLRVFVLVTCLALTADFSALPANGGDIQTPLEQLTKGDWIMQAQALEELARIGDKSSVPAIRQLLHNRQTSVYVRRRALVALARLDRDAVARDAKAFVGDSDSRLRTAAAEAYGYGDASVAKAPLGNLLKDKDQKVATAAVVSWAKLYGKDAWAVVDPATESLADPKLSPKAQQDLTWKFIPAMHALVYTGAPDAYARIDAIYKRVLRDSRFREPMMRGLATSGRPSALTMALRYLHKETAQNRNKVTKQNRKPADSFPRGRRLRSSDPVSQGLFAAIRGLGPEAVEAMVRTLLKSKAPQDLEIACALAAQLIPSPKTGDLLLKVCGESANAYVEHRCVGALMEPAMQPARYATYFKKVLESKHASSRIAGLDALVLCPDVNRYEAYSGIVEKGDDPAVLTAALEQLLSAPAKHVPRERIAAYLATAIADKDAKVRNAAAKLFQQAASKRDYPAVAKVWESLLHSKDIRVRETARKAIATIAPDDAQTELARNDGYLTEWRVLGTFIGGESLEKTPAYPPETELDFEKTYRAEGIFIVRNKNNKIPTKREKRTRTVAWRKGSVTTVNGLLRVNYFVSPPTRKTVAYAVATVTPKTPGQAIIWVEGVERQQLWFNGAPAITPKPKVPSKEDQYLWLDDFHWHHHYGSGATRATYKVTLKPGANQILIKTLNIGSIEWKFRVRVLNTDGSPLEVQQ